MNASTETRLKIRAGQKHFPLSLVAGLLEELDGLRETNATLRQARTARVSYIGGHMVKTENGAEMCEPVPVIEIRE